MALRKGSTIEGGYATVVDDDGVNYREIADVMCYAGVPMNHSSARNHVLRVMRTFVRAIGDAFDVDVPEERIDAIAKSPGFQRTIADMLQLIEVERRSAILNDRGQALREPRAAPQQHA